MFHNLLNHLQHFLHSNTLTDYDTSLTRETTTVVVCFCILSMVCLWAGYATTKNLFWFGERSADKPLVIKSEETHVEQPDRQRDRGFFVHQVGAMRPIGGHQVNKETLKALLQPLCLL